MNQSLSESPLDVLSRAATMVEKTLIPIRETQSPTTTTSSSSSSTKGCDRSPSFKERHPKFRKSSTPDYLVAAQYHRQNSSNSGEHISSSSSPTLQHQHHYQQQQQAMDIEISNRLSPPIHPATFIYSYHNLLQQHHQQQQQQQQQHHQQQHQDEADEGPLDMSIKKKPRSSSPPPPYRFPSLFTPTLVNPAAPPPPPYFVPSQISSLSGDRLPLPPPPTYEEASTQFALRASALAAVSALSSAAAASKRSSPAPPPRRPSPDAVSPADDPRPIREITIITADSSADPLLDEHFRRSLGANYQSLFKKSSTASSTLHPVTSSSSSAFVTSSMKSRSPSLSPDSSSTSNRNRNVDPVVKAFKDDMDMEGYTVEDHFAKALGDTWVKLQAAEEAKKGKSSKPTPVVAM